MAMVSQVGLRGICHGSHLWAYAATSIGIRRRRRLQRHMQAHAGKYVGTCISRGIFVPKEALWPRMQPLWARVQPL